MAWVSSVMTLIHSWELKWSYHLIVVNHPASCIVLSEIPSVQLSKGCIGMVESSKVFILYQTANQTVYPLLKSPINRFKCFPSFIWTLEPSYQTSFVWLFCKLKLNLFPTGVTFIVCPLMFVIHTVLNSIGIPL